jgi:hypothetical protein
MLLHLRAISREEELRRNPVNDFQISNDKARERLLQSPDYIQPILNSIKILVIV